MFIVEIWVSLFIVITSKPLSNIVFVVIFPIDIIFVLDNFDLFYSPIRFIKFLTVDELANVI